MIRTTRFATLRFVSPLAAQSADEPWRDSCSPVIASSGNDGVSFGARPGA